MRCRCAEVYSACIQTRLYRRALGCAGCLLAASATILPAAPAPPAPQRDWQSLRTPHFHVVGNAGARNLRQVAERLEQFREAFALIFPKAVQAAPRQVTVVVFRNHRAFEPFKPVRDGRVVTHVAGYYQGGHASDYVALTTEGSFDYGIVYHEYVHVLTKVGAGMLPVWFEEGLAEYYRSFEVTGRRRASLGRVLDGHVLRLREQWLPLPVLLGIDRRSPHYSESNKASVFYAQSWALVHYLLLGDQQKYAGRFVPFLQRLGGGASPEDASLEALQVPLGTLERDLRRYVQQNFFARQMVTFSGRLSVLDKAPVVPFAEADALATLGDLLLHMSRPDEARAHLQAALALDAGHARAHASMGRLLVEEERRDEARVHLERAVAGAGADWLTYYTYASVLNDARDGGDAEHEAAIERALRKAIELNPDYADSYAQLAWLKMRRPGAEAEVDALARQALRLEPGEDRFIYLYASVLVRQRKSDEARTLLRQLGGSGDAWVRSASADLLGRLERPGSAEHQRPPPRGAAGAMAADSEAGDSTFVPVFRTPDTGEEQAFGNLSSIECDGSAISLVLIVDGRRSAIRAARFEDVEFITYRPDLQGRVQCGPRAEPESVIVTYRPMDSSTDVLGEAVAVEFLPEGFRLR